MAAWTKDPKVTGAYWEQLPGATPDIVWIHDGMTFSPFQVTTASFRSHRLSVEYCASMGMMFYGPLDLPPEMPSDARS